MVDSCHIAKETCYQKSLRENVAWKLVPGLVMFKKN